MTPETTLSGARGGRFLWRHGVMRGYAVVTPEHTQCSYDEPPETGRDFRFVWAKNRTRAKWCAVNSWRRANERARRMANLNTRYSHDTAWRLRSEWLRDQMSDQRHPLTGLVATECELSGVLVSP